MSTGGGGGYPPVSGPGTFVWGAGGPVWQPAPAPSGPPERGGSIGVPTPTNPAYLPGGSLSRGAIYPGMQSPPATPSGGGNVGGINLPPPTWNPGGGPDIDMRSVAQTGHYITPGSHREGAAEVPNASPATPAAPGGGGPSPGTAPVAQPPANVMANPDLDLPAWESWMRQQPWAQQEAIPLAASRPPSSRMDVATNQRATSNRTSPTQSPGFPMHPGANPLSMAMQNFQANQAAQVPPAYQQYLPASFAF